MPTLHRTIDAAACEASELLDRYRKHCAFVVQRERIYGTAPGFEAMCHFEMKGNENQVAMVTKYRNRIAA